jgi:hypothetical protein
LIHRQKLKTHGRLQSDRRLKGYGRKADYRACNPTKTKEMNKKTIQLNWC